MNSSMSRNCRIDSLKGFSPRQTRMVSWSSKKVPDDHQMVLRRGLGGFGPIIHGSKGL